MTSKKQDIITFKVDKHFLKALEGIENRSDFIRSAVLAALESACPLCRGTGILTPSQRRHWEQFCSEFAADREDSAQNGWEVASAAVAPEVEASSPGWQTETRH